MSRVARRRRARRRRAAGAAAAVSVVAATTGAFLLLGGGEQPRAAPTPTTAEVTTTTAPGPVPTAIATSAVAELPIHPEPDAATSPIVTLSATTDYTLPTTLTVDATVEPMPPGWLPVDVPLRKPNGTPGWVQASHVTLSETGYLIRVSLSEHRVVLLEGDAEVLSTGAIIGTPETPTPTGRFFVTDPINCNTEEIPGFPVAQCDRAYGRFAIGTSGLSEALDSFAGTIPQIAIHGTFLPDTELGKDLSNGCVRIPNDAVLQLARLVPLGTPVEIVA